MESHLICEPHDNQHVVRVLRAVLNLENEDEPFIPSDFFNEMKISLEDRLESLYRNRKNRVLPEPSPFLATPDMVIFQNFQLGKWHNATITLQNKEQSSRCVKTIFEQTVHFRLLLPSKVFWTKVAPGMTFQLVISFCGDENRDYLHQITFVTEEEQFTIPIYAFKPRPLVDFPDFIRLPDVPINMPSEKNIIVCNHSKALGSFKIIATDPHCKVCPTKVVLGFNEKTFLKITMKTTSEGTAGGAFIIRFDDDVTLKMLVECKALPSSFLAESRTLRFEDTFMGLQRQVSFAIEYHAVGHGYFKWKSYQDVYSEQMRKLKLKEMFEEVRGTETLRSNQLTRTGIINQAGHSVVYQRILADEVEEMEETEEFLFRDSAFTIIPLSGDMGMNGELNFTIIFSPQACKTHEIIAYLEIAGSERRLPLKLQGTGLGPEFKLNIAHLDANNIFLRSVHDYEIIVANTGHIPGTLTFKEKQLEFGGRVRCDPDTISVSSNHYAAFIMSFTPGEEGKFIEKVDFVINESNEIIHFIMTGNVIAPLLNLEIEEIDFGIVALGYRQVKFISLCNNSPVPIQYHIEITADGYQTPIDADSYLQDLDFPQHPQEFTFEPVEGIVDKDSKIIGWLQLLPNVSRQLTTKFVIHMWGSKNYCISVPLKYDCRVADLVCIPSKVDIKFCFINYIYDRKIVLKNKSDLPCYFRFVPLYAEGVSVLWSNDQTVCVQKDDGLMIEVTIVKHDVKPREEVQIPLKIQTPLVGMQELPLFFSIFGKSPEMLCQVLCNGQGPAVCFTPPQLNFGLVTLLDRVTKELEILNDTPIPATINFSFKEPAPFSVKESVRLMPPSSKQSLKISVHLTDPGKSTYILWASVESGQEVAIVLTAYGEGTSISCTPKLEPKLDLGTLLTYKKFSFPILIKNEGARWHKLWFSKSDDYKIAKKAGNSSAGSVFKITPNYFHLMPKESEEIKIFGSRKEQGYVSEHFYCHAVIERSHKRHVIFSFEVIAKFLDPRVELNKTELNFNVDISSDGCLPSLRDKIKIRNECGLALEVDLVVPSPFFILANDKPVGVYSLKLNNLSNRTVTVEFHPPPHQKKCVTYQQTFYVNYKDHPKVEGIPIRGVINYPTVSVTPQTVDFGCVPLGSSTYRTVVVKNISSVPVIYKWVWVDDIDERSLETSVIPSSPDASICLVLEDQEKSKEESLEISVIEETVQSGDTCHIEEKIHDMLNSLLDKIEVNVEEQSFMRSLPPTCTLKSKFSEIFNVVPHEGCLEPDESIIAYFRFTPKPNTEVSATIYCHVIGGANEPVNLTGKCRQIVYYLKGSVINFGRVYFYEASETELPLVNGGEGLFKFTVSEALLPNGWLTIEPSSGSVPPGETFPLTIRVFPGTMGRFVTSFNIEIDYLDPVTITVLGFGVYPQIYFALSRPELYSRAGAFVAYSSIAELMEEPSCECAKDYFPEIDRWILEDDGWVIVSLNDSFPCMMEIELSIERIFVKYALEKDTSNLLNKLASGEKFWPLPNFVVAPYIFDLGCIPINSKNLYKLSYLNYGPGRTVIRTHQNPTFNTHGFDLPSIRYMMDLRQVNEIPLSFNPTTEKFPELNTTVTEFISMEVRNGAKIPIQLKALVATPTVRVSHEEVDFGAIRCGDCLRKSINIINNGYLQSSWKATIDESLKAKSKLKSSFFLLKQEGFLKPGEKFYLRIYFEPHYDDFLSAELIITVEGNERQTVVQLKGFGMEPFLEITEERITFEPNIPYSCDNERYVIIRNASKFPVEFFFPDFDQKIQQEEILVRTYIVGHMLNKVYFPYRAPGEDLPPMFQNYYDDLIREIEDKGIERRRSNSTDKKINSPGSSGLNRSREMSVLSWTPRAPNMNFEGKTNPAKENIINNYLMRKIKRLTKGSIITTAAAPLLPKITPDNEKLYEDPPTKGMLIVFHGAPLSQYIKAAHETGKVLNLPVCTIDWLIVDCLVHNGSPVAQEVNDLINQAFDDVAEDFEYQSSISEDTHDVITKKVLILLEGRKKKKAKPEKPKSEKKKKKGSAKGSKGGEKSSASSRESEENTKRTKNTKLSKESSKSSGKSKSKKSKESSKSGGKATKNKKHVVTDTVINIPQQLLCDLLKENLKNFEQGLIIESLSSIFLCKTMVAVNCLLQLAKNMEEIHFVIFWSTFEKYMKYEVEKENEQIQQEVINLDEFEASIDDMDEEEFAHLKEEFPDIYLKYIQKRKDDIIKRKNLIKQRKFERKQEILQTKRKESDVSATKLLSDKAKKKGKKNESTKVSKKAAKSGKGSTERQKETGENKKSSEKSSKKSKPSKKSKNSKSTKSTKKSSNKSSQKSSKEQKKKKLTKEQMEMKQNLDTFENTLHEILRTLEFFDKSTGLIRQSSVHPETKKTKNKKDNKISKSTKSNKTTARSLKSVKTTASSTETSLATARPVTKSPDMGIPCWIISSNDLKKEIESFVPSLMKSTIDLKVSHRQHVRDDFVEPPLLQSVLSKPKSRTLKNNSVFIITDYVEEMESLSKVKSAASSTGHQAESRISLTRRKKSSKSKSAVKDIEKPDDPTRETFTYRNLLQPGETIKYKISFLPKVVGNYKHQFDIGVIGSPLKFTITCVACCDIPRIDMDPYSLFERVLACRTERLKYTRGVFVEDTKRFQFGGILLPSAVTNSSFESKACFCLNNISRITCEVAFSIQRDCPAFQFQPDSHTIEPKARQELTVVASPFEEQLYDDKLVLSIKNNPKIEKIILSCYGCEIGVDVNPKHVLFERVTLEISLTKDIVITNNTPIEVNWYFVACEKVLENFSINSFGGRILPFSFQTCTVEFTAKEMEVHSCSFKVNIYDTQSRLVYTTDIMVSAETTALDFSFENELDYGDVKGWNSHNILFPIISKGRYEIHCQFAEITEENSENQAMRQYFKIHPVEGKILPDIRNEAVITFSPDRAMTIQKLPVFKCFLIDPFHEVVIKSVDIFVSAKVFVSKFEICPYPEIYLGYQAVGQEKMHSFQIVNKGKFDFNYTIKEYIQEDDENKKKNKKGKGLSTSMSKLSRDSKKSKKSKMSTKSKESKKSKQSKSSKKSKDSKKSKPKSSKSKSSKSSELKKIKPKPTTLNLGIFSLTSSTGVIDSGELIPVEVKSRPVEAGKFEKKIIVNVSEPSSKDRSGKIMKVQVIACEPKVNFEEISNIFKEQYLVEKMDDFLASNIDTKIIFARSDMKLKFNKVCVNTTEITRIRIQNIGHITAHVTARFSKPDHIFTVSPHSFSIDPYQTENVMIIYTPNSLDEHDSVLTFECRGFKTVDTLAVEVIGEACVPEIALFIPPPDESSLFTLNLPPTLIGNRSIGDIVFKNVGLIPCKVIVEVCFDEHDQFMLMPKEETIPNLNLWDPNAPMKHTTLVNLECGIPAEFFLQFHPQDIGTWRPEVKIHTVNNPFETKTIHIFGESYYTDLVFEGLPSHSRATSISSVDSTSVLAYTLDYGHVSLNTLEKKCFLIRNNADFHTYKFEFPNYNEVIFSPAVGHIRPQTSKQIVAVFLSRNPVDLSEVIIECKLYKIEYAEPQLGLLSWDDRQHFVVWCSEAENTAHSSEMKSETESKTNTKEGSIASVGIVDENILTVKRIEENPEPKITEIPNSSQNIAVVLTVVAGYATFFSDTREIHIPDTFVTNKNSVTFDVENTGKVSLKITWTASMHDLPRRINSCNSLDFTENKLQVGTNSKYEPTPLSGHEYFAYEDPLPRRASASTLFSCETLETDRSSHSWTDTHSLPFVVTPDKTTIEPNSKSTFTVTFAPVDVFDYGIQLKSTVDNKEPNTREIEIHVKARSILPVYCFELEPSDYIETRRRGRKMCKDLLDENTKVVEFESVGFGVICTRKFYLKNPTKEEFIYTWQPAIKYNPELSCFHCHTPNGTLSKGKTAEMVFSFIPQDCGIFEEFYLFQIPLHQIKVTFLLVGTAREPRIYFDQSHMDLPPTVVGIDVSHSVMLKNEEAEKHHFKFGKLPMTSEGLSIHPQQGFLEPNESFPIGILYRPKKKGSFNFDLKCTVEKIKTPIELNISCCCFEVEASATYIDHNGKEVQLHRNKLNVVNMGVMIPHQKYKIPINVTNIGKTGFQWYWNMRIARVAGLFDISFDSNEDILQPNEILRTKLNIMPLIRSRMPPHKIYFKISYGPTYAIQINGSAGKPPYKLSFLEYDFGPCLVQTAASKYYKTVLKFSNYNIFPMTLEKGTHDVHISTDFESGEILPRQQKDITIYFHPLILGEHRLELPLYIDSKRTHVIILGKAVPLNLSLVDQADKFVDLGPVLVGKSCTKTVRVLNDCECPINIIFNFWDRLPKRTTKEMPHESIDIPQEESAMLKGKKNEDSKSKDVKGSKKSSKKGEKSKGKKTTKSKKDSKGSEKSKKSKKDKKSKSSKKSKKDKKSKSSKKSKKGEDDKNSQKEQNTPRVEEVPIPKQGIDYMKIIPEKFSKIGRHKVTDFTITFSPKERVEPFLEKIYYKTQNYIDCICMVKGNSIAPSISLDRNNLTFGNVVVNFECMMNVVLRNTGDVQLKFKWLLDKSEEHFSITPNKGYILPGTDLIFNVYFRPKTVKCWIKSKLICHIPNINKQLQLVVSGSCINVPPPKGTIIFACPVRESDTKTISISNTSNQLWELVPHISGHPSFKTMEITRIPPQSEDNIEITFTPMTLQDKDATFCVPTPNGLIVSYNLKGVVKAPTPGKINREICCKVQHAERLLVKNWLLVKQQFHVSTSINGPVSARNLFSVGGNALIEVPPHGTRFYDWTITPINEGHLELKVVFTNKVTKEYQFYEISLKVLPNKELDVVELSTCARNSVTKLIKLENPLPVVVVYEMTCPQNNLEFEKTVSLDPHSVYYLELIYKPLFEEEENKTFDATCKEMGTFSYSLILKAHPAVPEPAVMFKTHLGQILTQNIEVVDTKTSQYKFDNPIFFLNSVVNDRSLSITFEPNDIGRFQNRLVLRSTALGDFIYPLIGDSCPPKPQGPFLLTQSSSATINFKNPFSEEKLFYFRIEPSDFIIKQTNEVIASKKVIKVIVNLLKQKAKKDHKYPVTGKMTIGCRSPDIAWVYYLQENVE